KFGSQRVEMVLHVSDEQPMTLHSAPEIRERKAQVEAAFGASSDGAQFLERHEKAMHGREIRSQAVRDVRRRHLAARCTQHSQYLEGLGDRCILRGATTLDHVCTSPRQLRRAAGEGLTG